MGTDNVNDPFVIAPMTGVVRVLLVRVCVPVNVTSEEGNVFVPAVKSLLVRV